jgi:rRNA maturation protein Nop10
LRPAGDKREPRPAGTWLAHMNLSRHFPTLPGIWRGVRFYLLAAAAMYVLFQTLHYGPVHWWSVRLNWWLGPWRNVPLPYDRDYFSPQTWPTFTLGEHITQAFLAILAATIGIAVLHNVMFGLAIVSTRWRGWPPYWADVRPVLDFKRLWAASAKWSAWLWMGAWSIWAVFEFLSYGQGYVWQHYVETGFPFFVAYLSAIFLGFLLISQRILRRRVVQVVDSDQRRCVGCGYYLRGLPSPRCPECGRYTTETEPIRFDLGRSWPHFHRRAAIGLMFMLLLSPLWFGHTVQMIPDSFVRRLPTPMQNWTFQFWHYRTTTPKLILPIRLDAVCVIHHYEGRAVIRFRKAPPAKATYDWAFWDDTYATDAPALTGTGVFSGWDSEMVIGRWTFRYSGGNNFMIWLYLPDAAFDVRVLRSEDAPAELLRHLPSPDVPESP